MSETEKLREEIKRDLWARADAAYCRCLSILQTTECLGVEYKLNNGRFTDENLKAHQKAAEQLGAHKALAEAARAIQAKVESQL